MNSNQVIPDNIAKSLWIITSLVAVSSMPILQLTTIDYASWNADIAQHTGTIIVAWSGAVASVLGLSRYAPSNGDKSAN